MACVDPMYQFYPYFSYKNACNDSQKYAVSAMYDPSDGLYCLPSNSTGHKDEELEKDQQPKGTQYLTSTCVLLTYFSGDIASEVDEHFSRALSQPSSYSASDRDSGKGTPKPDTSLLSQRKLPPSFWNSNYHSQNSTSGAHSFHLASDSYLASSLYGVSGLSKGWPYSFSQTYAHQPAHNFTYSSMDNTRGYPSHYGSVMMPPSAMSNRMDTRTGQFDLSKDSLAAGYYSMQRFGTEAPSNVGLETTGLPGFELPLQAGKKDAYW